MRIWITFVLPKCSLSKYLIYMSWEFLSLCLSLFLVWTYPPLVVIPFDNILTFYSLLVFCVKIFDAEHFNEKDVFYRFYLKRVLQKDRHQLKDCMQYLCSSWGIRLIGISIVFSCFQQNKLLTLSKKYVGRRLTYSFG